MFSQPVAFSHGCLRPCICTNVRAEEADRLQALRTQLEEDQSRLLVAAGELAKREEEIEWVG
jgi:hypothetical protein